MRPSALGLSQWPVERVAAGYPATCSRASASLQACWPTWWSRTSQCGGAKGSALAGSTNSGSLIGGNAHAPIRPSANEDCWPHLCSLLLPCGPHQGPFPAPLPLPSITEYFQPDSLDPGNASQARIPCIVLLGLVGQVKPIALRKQLEFGSWGTARCCGFLHSRLWSCRTGLSAWAAEYIFYL